MISTTATSSIAHEGEEVVSLPVHPWAGEWTASLSEEKRKTKTKNSSEISSSGRSRGMVGRLYPIALGTLRSQLEFA
jgi:BRCT domain type II-containing protein